MHYQVVHVSSPGEIYKERQGLALEHITYMFQEHIQSRALRSMESEQVVEPRVQTKHGVAVMLHATGTNCEDLRCAPNVAIFLIQNFFLPFHVQLSSKTCTLFLLHFTCYCITYLF